MCEVHIHTTPPLHPSTPPPLTGRLIFGMGYGQLISLTRLGLPSILASIWALMASGQERRREKDQARPEQSKEGGERRGAP